MKENKQWEDELIMSITGKKVSEILHTCDLKELLRLSGLLTFFKSI